MDDLSFAVLAKKEEFPFDMICLRTCDSAYRPDVDDLQEEPISRGGAMTESKAEAFASFIQILAIGSVLRYCILYFALVGYAEFEKPAVLQARRIPLKPAVRWIAVHGLALYVRFAY
eukprot:EC119907.1.p1 GENE.EC119907.1~~EC119907.1.p1  ORF type:complete len:117 (+),score=0.27 EC119907.1:78-428(+)